VLHLTAAAVARGVQARRLDAVEIVERAVRALEVEDLNAVITLMADRALDRAGERPRGPLAGVPVLVKDIFDTAGTRTTYGSRVFREHVPARSAEAVRRLEQSGAVVVGKANLHEFAWGVTGRNPWYGTVRNPTRPGRIAGGSSSGNAAALAAGLVPLGLGTDTGGSLRIPAACCGVVGFKPAVGTLSTDGAFPLAPSYDTAGPLARTVADCALTFAVLAGRALRSMQPSSLRVGILDGVPRLTPVSPNAPDWRSTALAERLGDAGLSVVRTELPVPRANTASLWDFEAARSHAATYPSLREQYGADLRVKLDAARAVTPADARTARAAVQEWRQRAQRELRADVIATPTLGVCPLPPHDAWEPDVRELLGAYTRPFNVLGWAALAIGNVQLAGPSEDAVLAAGLALERADACLASL